MVPRRGDAVCTSRRCELRYLAAWAERVLTRRFGVRHSRLQQFRELAKSNSKPSSSAGDGGVGDVGGAIEEASELFGRSLQNLCLLAVEEEEEGEEEEEDEEEEEQEEKEEEGDDNENEEEYLVEGEEDGSGGAEELSEQFDGGEKEEEAGGGRSYVQFERRS
nr:unnamed protein product [Spirometra erinaceieuropaei]